MKNAIEFKAQLLSASQDQLMPILINAKGEELSAILSISEPYENDFDEELSNPAKTIKRFLGMKRENLEQMIRSQTVNLINALRKKGKIAEVKASEVEKVDDKKLEVVIERLIKEIKVNPAILNSSVEETLKDLVSGLITGLLTEHGIGAALLCLSLMLEKGKAEDYLDTLIPKGTGDIRINLNRVALIVSGRGNADTKKFTKQLARGSNIDNNIDLFEKEIIKLFLIALKQSYEQISQVPGSAEQLEQEKSGVANKPIDNFWRQGVSASLEIERLENMLAAGIINIPNFSLELDDTNSDHNNLAEVGRRLLKILRLDREVVATSRLAVQLYSKRLEAVKDELKALFEYLDTRHAMNLVEYYGKFITSAHLEEMLNKHIFAQYLAAYEGGENTKDIKEKIESRHEVTSPLLFAVKHGLVLEAKDLIKSGKYLDVRAKDGDTPLIRAVSRRHTEMTKLLLEEGVDPNLQGAFGDTALCVATQGDSINIEVIKLLLEKNASPHIKNQRSNTPLFLALLSNAPEEAIKVLLKSGANVNEKGQDGNTPLHLTVGRDNKEIIKLLLAKGADQNIGNVSGRTPLSLAGNNKEIVDILLADKKIGMGNILSATNVPLSTRLATTATYHPVASIALVSMGAAIIGGIGYSMGLGRCH